MKALFSNSKLRRTMFPVLPLLALAVLVACGSSKDNAKGQQLHDAAVPVTVAAAFRKDVPIQVKAIGNVEPYNTVSVKSMVAGEITKVGFSEGQDVKKGDMIFVIDPRPYEAALAQAEGNLAKDRANTANAKAEATRWAALYKEGVASREQHDQIATQAQAMQETVTADEAAVQNAKVNLTYCTIKSPIDGRTGNLMVKIGNVVKANDVPLVTINQVLPIYVTFSVSQQFLPDIKRADRDRKLVVAAKVQGEAQSSGVLTFIDNSVDPQTGMIKLKGTFSNGDRRLWPGQFADVSLTLGVDRNAVLVPSAAVQTGQDGQFVFVIKNNKADMKRVIIGRIVGSDTVIQSGVDVGDQVVTDGQLRLTPGAKVAVANAPSSTSQASEKGPNPSSGATAAKSANGL
jgi:multidrug efflux system membrane fusion protein